VPFLLLARGRSGAKSLTFELRLWIGTISEADLSLFKFRRYRRGALEAIDSWEGVLVRNAGEIPGR